MTSPLAPTALQRRTCSARFGRIASGLRYVVAVPARDEAEALPKLVRALDAQRDAEGSPFARGEAETLVLLNNCRDGSVNVLAALAAERPWLRFAVVALGPREAHVGRARQLVLDAACERLLAAGAPGGLLLSTDADTEPAPDWIASAVADVAAGADLVGGRVLLHADERAALAPGVRRLFLLDVGYRRALEELRSLLAPEAHDPFPRHHQHFGACLAVTAAAYVAAGGVPAVSSSEDVALVRAVEAAGGRVRHSYRMRAATSARLAGRAAGGLADAFTWWTDRVRQGQPVLVESAPAAERRLRALGRWRRSVPGAPPPHLLHPPEPPPPEDAERIERVLQDLRATVERLRRLPSASRLPDLPQSTAPALAA